MLKKENEESGKEILGKNEKKAKVGFGGFTVSRHRSLNKAAAWDQFTEARLTVGTAQAHRPYLRAARGRSPTEASASDD